MCLCQRACSVQVRDLGRVGSLKDGACHELPGVFVDAGDSDRRFRRVGGLMVEQLREVGSASGFMTRGRDAVPDDVVLGSLVDGANIGRVLNHDGSDCHVTFSPPSFSSS